MAWQRRDGRCGRADPEGLRPGPCARGQASLRLGGAQSRRRSGVRPLHGPQRCRPVRRRPRQCRDSHDDGGKVFEVFVVPTGSSAVPATGVSATVTIENDDPLPGAWLARFGRAVAERALDGITARMGGGPHAGPAGLDSRAVARFRPGGFGWRGPVPLPRIVVWNRLRFGWQRDAGSRHDDAGGSSRVELCADRGGGLVGRHAGLLGRDAGLGRACVRAQTAGRCR